MIFGVYFSICDSYHDKSYYLLISSVPGLDIHICSPLQYWHTCDCSRRWNHRTRRCLKKIILTIKKALKLQCNLCNLFFFQTFAFNLSVSNKCLVYLIKIRHSNMILQKNFLKTNNFTRRGTCCIILARTVITFANIWKRKQEALRVLQPGLSDAVLGMISKNLLNKYHFKIRQTIRDNVYSIVTLAIVFCGKACQAQNKSLCLLSLCTTHTTLPLAQQ